MCKCLQERCDRLGRRHAKPPDSNRRILDESARHLVRRSRDDENEVLQNCGHVWRNGATDFHRHLGLGK
eukprot:scaffold152710_cov35-Tisochrysis_lutea.AAC.1